VGTGRRDPEGQLVEDFTHLETAETWGGIDLVDGGCTERKYEAEWSGNGPCFTTDYNKKLIASESFIS